MNTRIISKIMAGLFLAFCTNALADTLTGIVSETIGDDGIESTMVIAINDQDEYVDTTYTDTTGYYIFSNLETGSYQIKLALKES